MRFYKIEKSPKLDLYVQVKLGPRFERPLESLLFTHRLTQVI